MKEYQFCCEDMLYNIMETHSVTYNEIFDEYSIKVVEDGVSCFTLNFCPWCGIKLPASQRSEWFSRLEAMGITEPFLQEKIPSEYRNSDWRSNTGDGLREP